MQKYHKPPEIALVYRAPFHRWLFDRNKSVAEGARMISTSQQTLERNLLSPDNKRFIPASVETRRRVEALTMGEVTMGDWPESLKSSAADYAPAHLQARTA